MRWFDQLTMKFTALFRRRAAGAHLDAELAFHLERQIAENRAAGMTHEEAHYAALRTFGNPALLRDQSRSTWSWASLESLARDVRYNMRSLLRTPGFSLIAIAVMGLGIGANIALFTIVRSVLLKPLPFQDSDRLVALYEADSQHKHRDPHMPVAFGSFSVWQSAARDVAQMAAVSPWQDANVSAESGKLPEKVRAAWCSWNFFSILGVQPALGRGFTAQDDDPSAPAAVVLAHSFWMRRYSGDPAIVGKTIYLDAKPYTVIGVLPTSFKFFSSFGGGSNLMVWLPVRHEAPAWLLTTFEDHEFIVIARLLHGVTLPSLVEQLKAIQKQTQMTHARPAVHDSAIGRSMLDDAVDSYKTPLYALLAATACVLLIACMNVASLLVARTAARGKELAIRSALGGGRLRLMRERLIEGLLLSVAGGALGLTLAWSALRWLIYARADMNRIDAIYIDGVVAAFAVAVIALCALFSGLIAAFSATGKHLLTSLQESSRAHSGGTARAGLRRLLLVLEVSLTVVLLVGAGLLLRSYQRLRTSDIGVPADNVLTMTVSLPTARYKEPAQQVAFFEQLITRVRAIPGVQSAGLVSTPPGEGWNGDQLMTVVEHPPLPIKDVPDIQVRGADPGYFAAIQLPLLRGRIFTPDERLARDHVVVISETAARALFPNDDPLGKHLKSENGNDPYEVIGIVGDTRWNVSQPPMATLYWPIYGNGYSFASIVVRSARNVDALALPVEKVVGAMDPDLPVADVMTLREAIGKSTIDSAFDSILVLAFAVIALLLAAAGLYGVLAYLVAQRTNEIGIRMALGAQRENVLRLMLADGLRPALLGLVVGLAASAAVVREIRSMLYETAPLDPGVFASVTAALLIVSALACLIPAWRASRLNPMQALRTE
jgi:putative ABC transport system permease protein